MIRKGTYVLFLHIPCDTIVNVGSIGPIPFQEGYYCYVGSAMGGLDQRINRHISKEKRLRWHIDYLTTASDDVYAFESSGDCISECDLAKLLSDNGSTPAVEGFGCSDCNCATHLFRAEPAFLESILVKNGLTKFVPKIE